jgi:dolichol-phosphate mannosyltransferase
MIHSVMALPKEFDLLIVDDNSKDGTAEIIIALQKTFPNRLHLEQRAGKLGLGTAYIHGFKWALQRKYAYIFEMDADFSHNPNDVISLYNACAKDGADMSIGSRYITGVNVVNWPMGRVIMSYYASMYVRIITGMDIRDTTAGFKCYSRKILETIDFDKIRFTGYAFQIEMKFAAWKLGFKIKEVAIIFTDRSEGQSKMSGSIFKEAIFGVLSMKIKSLYSNYRKA